MRLVMAPCGCMLERDVDTDVVVAPCAQHTPSYSAEYMARAQLDAELDARIVVGPTPRRRPA